MSQPGILPVYNVSCGLLGHVDSGKTSLARALSSTLSTAALDKSPQSAERGITLDLGFSSFAAPLPSHLIEVPYSGLQVTLVDCPGHASLIRTIVGGAQIVDFIVLVVDCTKGMQTQTAECLVIGELTTDKLVVALNKADLLPAETREATLARLRKRLATTLAATRFAGCSQVVVSARPGGDGAAGGAEGMEELVTAMLALAPVPQPESTPLPPFLLAVDHCFTVRGQGAVLTGTVLRGRVAVGQAVELPALRMVKKVKSLQAFRVPVTSAGRGDRVGLCLAQFDSKLFERGLVAEPGSVPTFLSCIAAVERIRFFKGPLPSKCRLHVTLGHATVMATLTFFREGTTTTPLSDQLAAGMRRLTMTECAAAFSLSREYEATAGLEASAKVEPGDAEVAEQPAQWALCVLDSPVVAPPDALLIGARLDMEATSPACRLALHGRLAAVFGGEAGAAALHLFKRKMREGSVERWADERTAVCRGMFKRETDISLFTGMRVLTGAGQVGTIQGAFGKSGKYKVTFAGGVPEEQRGDPDHLCHKLFLHYKKAIGGGSTRKMTQV